VVTAPVQQRSPALGGYGGSAQPQVRFGMGFSDLVE